MTSRVCDTLPRVCDSAASGALTAWYSARSVCDDRAGIACHPQASETWSDAAGTSSASSSGRRSAPPEGRVCRRHRAARLHGQPPAPSTACLGRSPSASRRSLFANTQAYAEGLETKVQHLAYQVEAAELETRCSAAQVQALSEYVCGASTPSSSGSPVQAASKVRQPVPDEGSLAVSAGWPQTPLAWQALYMSASSKKAHASC